MFLDTVRLTNRGIDIVGPSKGIVNKAYNYIANNAQYSDGLDYIKYMTTSSTENKLNIVQELGIFDKLRNQKYEDFLNDDIVKWLNGK